MLKQQLADKQDTIVKLPREKGDLAPSATQKVDSPKQTSNVKTKNLGDSFSPTQEVSKVILMQNACSSYEVLAHAEIGIVLVCMIIGYCAYNMCWWSLKAGCSTGLLCPFHKEPQRWALPQTWARNQLYTT